jgi:hypothetical protein
LTLFSVLGFAQVPTPASPSIGESSDALTSPAAAAWMKARKTPETPAEYVAAIMKDDDPIASSDLLESSDLQKAVRDFDPVAYTTVFARAAELGDLHRILQRDGGAETLRIDLLVRPACRFCWDSRKMQLWVARDPYVIVPTLQVLPSVYLDWSTLSGSQKSWLSARGAEQGTWSGLGLQARWDKLDAWAKGETAALMEMNPSTAGEADAMMARAEAVQAIEGGSRSQDVMDRAVQAQLAVKKLGEARANAGLSKDPSIQRALTDAQSAADPQARLAALSRLFDGLGRPDAAVRAAAPAAPSQVFDGASRKLTADLLRTGLLRETQGTWAGQGLADFYASHPLNIDVGPAKRSAVAWYHDGALSFNETYIQEFVKARGKSIGDLAHDPGLLGDLTKEVAPTFVHEATHQVQEAWTKELGIPFELGESVEPEAMAVQSLYVLQKEKIDPSYRKYVAARAATSVLVREDLGLAEDLRQVGAEWFGNEIMAGAYPGYPSIASTAWTNMVFGKQVASRAQAELDRRSKLSAAERGRLSALADLKGKYDSLDALYADFQNVNDGSLRSLLGKIASDIDLQPQVYNDYAGRLRAVDARTDARLKELGLSPTDAVPLPASAKP